MVEMIGTIVGKVVGRVVAFVVFAIIAIPLYGFVVMQLWNWLAPDIFGWHTIAFAQALGLLFLSRILFGGWRGPRGGRRRWNWRGRLRDRWQKMTPEEREKFQEGMHRRCGDQGESQRSTWASSDIGL